jgi:hypothetical protein
MIKTIVLLLISVVTAAGGVFLGMFAEADDAPGGVVIAGVVILAAIILAVMAIQGKRGQLPPPRSPS